MSAMICSDQRFNVIYRPFAETPYCYSYGYMKVCYALACLKDLTIEEDQLFVVVNDTRMEIYGLVVYIYQRLRGRTAHSCDFETVFKKYQLKRVGRL